MTRIALSRLPGDRVLVVEGDGEDVIELVALPALVEEREADSPRWVWDDTARWYPALLAAGDPGGALPRPPVEPPPAAARAGRRPGLLDGPDSGHWDRLGPATASEAALFSVDDTAEYLRADAEDARQLAAVTASTEPTRLGLLLAAESSGALVAAEMTHAGLPWRVDVHERLLVELLGPRPPRGGRPVEARGAGGRGSRGVRRPGLNPDSQPELLAVLRRAGLDVADTRASSLRVLEHPGIPAWSATASCRTCFSTNGWAWIDQWVRDGRFRPTYQPAGSTTGRWSSNGGGALSIPIQVRPAAVADDGWTFVVADVAQLEPRVLAGMSGDGALARSARGADLYQGMVDDGAVASRKDAKLGLLGAMYGATSGESGRMLAGLAKRYPAGVRARRGRGARGGARSGGPHPARPWVARPRRGVGPRPRRPAGRDSQTRLRRSYGRFTRNFVVQGTGAEWALCWIADLRNRLWRLGGTGPVDERPHLVFFLHDEVVVHTPVALADAVAEQAREAAATAAGLVFRELPVDFPLNISVVESYADAGKPGTG